MKTILDTNNIRTAIRRARNYLKAKAKKSGIYENFGQNEVREIKDKFIDISNYTYAMNSNRAILQEFDNWCMNFDLSNL